MIIILLQGDFKKSYLLQMFEHYCGIFFTFKPPKLKHEEQIMMFKTKNSYKSLKKVQVWYISPPKMTK